MTHSFTRCYVHIVFATRHRRPMLTDDLRPAMLRYMAGAIRQSDCDVLAINGVADHVHILIRLSKRRALADIIREAKRGSTRWLKDQSDAFSDFHWQTGYAAFSVSHNRLDAVRRYIDRQEAHHAMTTFDVEYMRLLQLQRIEFKDEHLWS